MNKSRLTATIVTEAAMSAALAIGLDYLWYKKFPHSKFHFFNDNKEWLNMDKAGHATTAYNVSAAQYDILRWAGVDKTSATIYGGLTGLGFLTVVELFDGISEKWGFSYGDMIANITGSGLFMTQQFLWDQQRLQLRFSYHKTIYPQYNPGELGKNFWQRLLKDYNGQTYWLSVNIASFASANSGIPRWLNADIGYGAEGMIGARENPAVINGNPVPHFQRYRQIYFGAGAAFTSSYGSQTPYAGWLNTFRLPTPVMEWNLNKTAPKLKALYF